MPWQEFFLHHCLTESVKVEGALFRGFLRNLTRQVFLFFFSSFFSHHCVTLSICEFGIILNLLDCWTIDFFPPPILWVVGCKGEFLSSVEIALREAFWDHSQSIWWVLGPSNFFTHNFGGGCRGWFSFMARKITADGKSLLNLPKITHLACCIANYGR